VQRARVLELSSLIACDIHPVNNLRILKYLQDQLGVTAAQKDEWYRHWIDEGLAAVERLLVRYGSGPFCFGAAPTLADCCLVPQIANAERMGCVFDAYPGRDGSVSPCHPAPGVRGGGTRTASRISSDRTGL
jgi:maleylacetoacetate isomerase